jgi:hypothetical protein
MARHPLYEAPPSDQDELNRRREGQAAGAEERTRLGPKGVGAVVGERDLQLDTQTEGGPLFPVTTTDYSGGGHGTSERFRRMKFPPGWAD